MALSAVVAAASVLAPRFAAPAAAEPPVTAFTAPAESEVLETPMPVISGEVRMTEGVLVEDIRLDVVSRWDHPGASTVVPAAALPSRSFSFTPLLSYNGPYQAVVTATGKDLSLEVRTDTTVVSRSFSLAVPPTRPAGVQVSMDPVTRTATVTWKANPEPDIIGYQLRRSFGPERRSVVGTTSQTSLVDRLPASVAGEFRYEVVAVRVGPSADSAVTSRSAVTDVVTVPEPPGGLPPPTAGDSGPAASPVPEGGKVDAFRFRSLMRPSDVTPAPVTASPATDAPSGQSSAEGGTPQAGAGTHAALGRRGLERGQADRGRAFAVLAAGLLTAVVALHARWSTDASDRGRSQVR